MTELKTPKGCFDYNPQDVAITEFITGEVTRIFKKHGAVSLDTPTFELSSILKNKYGDDSKLIFDLQSCDNSEKYSLRYDLTVSLARYLAQNKICKLKRYQLGKVFRKDLPSIVRGRFCEFLQCDFDICGTAEHMVSDAEILKIAIECLEALLPEEKFILKVNHRKLHTAFLNNIGIHPEIHNTVCSTIDKFGKMGLFELRDDFKSKGVTETQIDAILDYIKLSGKGLPFLSKLKDMEIYKTADGKVAVDDLVSLHEYATIFNIQNKFEFDLSLSRGTDYYTGIIFEASYKKHKVGSVLGGGRYDDLVKNFVKYQASDSDTMKRSADSEDFDVPCIGFSVGIARIFSILKSKKQIKASSTQVYIGNFGSSLLKERLQILNELWDANISAETFYGSLNFRKQAAFAQKNSIPMMLAIGDNEITENKVQISYGEGLKTKKLLDRSDMANYIKSLLQEINFE